MKERGLRLAGHLAHCLRKPQTLLKANWRQISNCSKLRKGMENGEEWAGEI